MKKKILVWSMVLALVAVLVVPMAVFAVVNDASQGAETTKAATIAIQNQAASTDVTSITFPAAAGGTTGVIPYNNLDGIGTPQLFDASTSLPVVTLVTTTAYIAWINITDVTDWAVTVSAEDYYIITDGTRTVAAADFTNNKSTFGTWGTEETTLVTLEVSGTNDNDLYLTIDLQSVGGSTGTSTLTVLGETP